MQHVIDELGLDRPAVDPTALTADELVAEMQQSIKALLGIGARLPKELMLFVKNMVFLDGAIATLAPDLDLFARDRGASPCSSPPSTASASWPSSASSRPTSWAPDMTGIKAGFGLDAATEGLTHRELQARRAQVREKFDGRGARAASARAPK